MGLNCTGIRICRFLFSVNIQSSHYILRFHIREVNQPQIETAFLIHYWDLQDAEARLHAFPTPRIRGLSIQGFRYLQGVL